MCLLWRDWSFHWLQHQGNMTRLCETSLNTFISSNVTRPTTSTVVWPTGVSTSTTSSHPTALNTVPRTSFPSPPSPLRPALSAPTRSESRIWCSALGVRLVSTSPVARRELIWVRHPAPTVETQRSTSASSVFMESGSETSRRK